MYDDTRKTKTGFCSGGQHEGGRYPTQSGKFLKTCGFIQTCGCNDPTCHSFYDRMFEASGLDRVVVDNSGYSPDHGGFVWDYPTIVAASPILSSGGSTMSPDVLESVAPGTLPPVKRASWQETPTGRAGRGQLEHQVNAACIEWLADEGKNLCTPQYLSVAIGKSAGIKPPSTGAINSVFLRFQGYGYAVIERRPTRFVKFTDYGVQFGLDYMKNRAKHK